MDHCPHELDHVSTCDHTLERCVYAWRYIGAKFQSPSTAMLPGPIHTMDVGMPFSANNLIVKRAILLRATRSQSRGETIFHISSFTEYKRTGLSAEMVKMNRARHGLDTASVPVQ